MHRVKLIVLFLSIFSTYSFAQINNPDFEIWEPVFSEEGPKYWDCDGLGFDACTKVTIDINNFAVRMDNSLPCVDPITSEGKSLGNGRLSQQFKAPSKEFILSYDLLIDSLDAPATFNVRLMQIGIGTALHIEYREVFEGNISHHITLENEVDSLFIQFEPKGELKQNAAHDCDRGYISGIIDNVKAETIVSTNQIKKHNTKIYPNPSNGLVYIEQADAIIEKVEVYDSLGRLVKHQFVSTRTVMELNLKGNANLYFLKITYLNGAIDMESVFVQ